jgi:hypothetical protein
MHATAAPGAPGLADGPVGGGAGLLAYWSGHRWLGRGRAAAVRALDEDPTLWAALRRAVLSDGA